MSITKLFKKSTKAVNKLGKHAEHKFINSNINTGYNIDKVIEGKEKAKKHLRKAKHSTKSAKSMYNKASNAYDNADTYLHKKIRNIPIVGKGLDEGFYMADTFLNPIGQFKNIGDTLSGKQSLTDGLMNEYAGEAVYAKGVYDRNFKKKKGKKKKKKKKKGDSKTIEKDRPEEEDTAEIFY